MVADDSTLNLIRRVRNIEHDLERTKTVENAAAGGGGSIPAPTARGDMIAATAAPAWALLPLGGASGYVLTRDDTDPTWSNVLAIGADDQIGLQIRAHSAGQSAHLQEWQDSTTAVLLWVDEAGNIHLPQNTSVVGAGIIYKEDDIFIHNYYRGFGIVNGFNTFMGVNSGNLSMGLTATELYHASCNTAVGFETLSHNTIGFNNSAFGYHALHANTEGASNVAIGHNVLRYNLTGSQNIGIGSLPLNTITSGDNNIGIGSESIGVLIAGDYNIGIGYKPLYNFRVGGTNLVIGNNALYSLCPRWKDIIGFTDYSGTVPGTVRASSVNHGLPAGTTADVSILGGSPYDGIYTVTRIDANAFYFTHAYTSNGTGYWFVTTEAIDNVSIGTESGLALALGAYNVLVGYYSGYLLEDANYNTFIGYNTGNDANQSVDVTNSIALGYNAFTDKDNQAVYGNPSMTEHLLHGSPGRCKSWTYDGVDDTAQTVIAHGTYDVTQGITVVYVISANAGETLGGTIFLEPSDSYNIYDDGSETVALAVAADGSVTVQRTAGADTYDVVFWCVWI